MDFGALPPEVNSLRIYSGPGSAPMLAAATAWAALGAELRSTADLYDAVITGLTSEEWTGPASTSMAAAAFPYVTWMNLTGAQAEQTSAQASAAAAAYEAAFAMTVPPPEVAANRALLAALVATNFFGQNMAAIAATEALYGEMWAQDAAAMYGYAGSSSAASTLIPFEQPEQTTNPAGVASQAASVAQAVGAGTGTQAVDQLMSAVPTALQGLASPISQAAAAVNPAPAAVGDILAAILNFLDGADGNAIGTFLNSSFVNGFVSAGYVAPGILEPAVTATMADVNAVAVAAAPDATALPAMGSGSGNALALPLGTAAIDLPALQPASGAAGLTSWGGVSAGTNQATLVGRLSVPQSWAAATGVTNYAGAAAPGGGWTSAAGGLDPATGMPGVPGMPAAGMYGHGFGNGPRYGFRPTIMARPPAAG